MKLSKALTSLMLVLVCFAALAATNAPSGGCAMLDNAATESAALNPGTPATQPATQPTPLADGAVIASNVASNPGVQAAASVVPYGSLALAALGLVASVYLKVQSAANGQRAKAAEGVIANAAPGIASLVSQTTGNTTIGGAITAAGTVAPAVIALLNHPAAVAATAPTKAA